ncbi:M1 family metallopeptidase [Candidatus Bipolaricaulota sp. J31]
MRFCFAAFLLSLCFSLVVAGAEVHIEASFSPEDHTISGIQRMKFTSAPRDTYFLLLANLGKEPNPHLSGRLRDELYPYGFDPSWTVIDRVLWREEGTETELSYELLPFPAVMQTYSLDDGILRVELPEGKAGTLVVHFRTKFPATSMGEPGRIQEIHTWRFGWHPIPYPASPDTWDAYGFRLPAYRYSLELSLPAGWVAALPGDRVEREKTGERVVYRVEWDQPVRTLSLYFAPEGELGSFTFMAQGIALEGWYLPGYEEEVRALATRAVEILAWYGERFGPCPYRRLLLAMHPNEPGASFTADGIVLLSRWYFDRMDLSAKGILARVTQFVLAHELAHLWWGIGIGVDFDSENWLSEAFAQYLSISWFEDTYGAEGGNTFITELKGLGEEMAEKMLGFVNLREHLVELPYLRTVFMGFDEAVVKPYREVRYHNVDHVRIYDKGYLVVRALAHYLGEETFQRGLREVHGRFAGGELTVEEFRRTLEEVSGTDLAGFFSTWVRGEAWADYEVLSARTRSLENGDYETEITLEFRGNGPLPVEVVLQGVEREKRFAWTPDPETPVRVVTVTTSFRPLRVSIDPEHRVPDVDRLNNHYPRRFAVIFGKNDLPLDAYYLKVLDPSSGAIQGGYLDRFAWAVFPQERYVTGFVRYGRAGELNAWAQVRDDDGLIGAIAWTQYLWTTPDVGIAGGFWQLAGTVSIGAFKLPDTEVMPLLDLSWFEVTTDVYWGNLSLLYNGDDHRFWLSLGKEIRLAPRTYLQLSAGFGRATAGMPELLSFGLEELFSFQGRGHEKLFLQGTLWVPPWDENYRIGGLLLLDRVLPGAFVSAARLDDGPWMVEGGFVCLGQLEALGGFLTLNVFAGVVYPLLPEPGEGKLFLGISQGF